MPVRKFRWLPGYQVAFGTRIRREAEIPTMSVGLIADPQQAEEIITSGEADLIALARGALYDPRWAWHAAEALGAETAYAPEVSGLSPVATSGVVSESPQARLMR